jgi:hypothetical protein
MYIYDNYSFVDIDPKLEPFLGKKDLPIYNLEIHNYYVSPEMEMNDKINKWVDLEDSR